MKPWVFVKSWNYYWKYRDAWYERSFVCNIGCNIGNGKVMRIINCKLGRGTLFSASRGTHLLFPSDLGKLFYVYNFAVRGSPVFCTTSLLLSQLKPVVIIVYIWVKRSKLLLCSNTTHGPGRIWTHDLRILSPELSTVELYMPFGMLYTYEILYK